MNNILGFDIGGTKCAIVLGRVENTKVTFLQRKEFLTAGAPGPDRAISAMIEKAEGILRCHSVDSKDISAIGVSCGGPLDSEKGIILSPPNLIGWDCVPIVEMLEKHFGVPARLQNDANAGALAEWMFGAARGTKNAVFITFGTGCGAGLILDGKLYGGANGMAGECGHLRLSEFGPVGYGKAGSMEGFCSGNGIAQLAGMMALEQLQRGGQAPYCGSIDELGKIDVKQVAQAARNGNIAACKTFAAVGKQLGRGLAVFVDLLNPEVIVLGGIFGRCYDLLWGHTERMLKREALGQSLGVCRITPAKLGESIGDYAAIAAAKS